MLGFRVSIRISGSLVNILPKWLIFSHFSLHEHALIIRTVAKFGFQVALLPALFIALEFCCASGAASGAVLAGAV